MTKRDAVIALLLIGLIITVRLIPHLPNATPVAAAALAGGVYLRRWWSLVIPLAGMLLSDLFIGLYSWQLMLSVYGSFALIGLLSWWLRKYKSAANVLLAGLSASILFFVITNAAVWAFSPWYTKDLAGFLYCFELALPFFRNMLAGDLVYTILLFGIFESAPSVRRAYAGMNNRTVSGTVSP